MKKLLLFLLAITSFYTSHTRHARMIMPFDIENTEANEYRMVSDKPIVGDIILALYEKAAPILMTANLWHQILFHYKEFKEKLLDTTSEEHQYHQIFLTMKQYSKDIFPLLTSVTDQEKKAEIAQKVQEKLNNDKQYKEYQEFKKLEAEVVENKTTEPTDDIEAAHDLYVIMHDFFKLEEWDIYYLNTQFILCIPHIYKQNIIQAFVEECKKFNMLEHITNSIAPLTIEEIALGLHINRYMLQRIKASRLEDLPMTQKEMSKNDIDTIQKTHYLVNEIFTPLFIIKKDIPKSLKESIEFILPTWNFFLNGHGGFTFMSFELKNALTEMEKLQKEIGFIRGISEQLPKNEKAEKKRAQNKKIAIGQFSKEAAEERQKKIEQLYTLDQEVNIMLGEAGGSLASLSFTTFSSMLNFLDTCIFTDILCYFTCFSGGQHLHLPFISKAIYKVYNFTLIAAVASDTVATGDSPYFAINNLEAKDFVITKTGIELDFSKEYSYLAFFDLQEHNAPLKKVLETIIPPSEYNVPTIKLPGMTWFSIMQLRDTVNLNRVTISNASKKAPFPIHDKRLVLFQIPYIPLELAFSTSSSFDQDAEKDIIHDPTARTALHHYKKELFDSIKFPYIVSTLPGNALHWIKKMSAPKRFFTSFVFSMIASDFIAGENDSLIAGEKIYLVDELTTINNFSTPSQPPTDELTTFKQVTFFNNVLLDPLDFKNTDYNLFGVFFIDKNQGYKIMYKKTSQKPSIPETSEKVTLEEEIAAEEESTISEATEQESPQTEAPPTYRNVTQETLDPHVVIEQMTDKEFTLYKGWYKEQKAKAKENAHLLIETSAIEDFVRKHSLEEKETVQKKTMRKRRTKTGS
ncbi:MAG TPA: hypothetical protein VEK38_03415 [Candidatus Bathyarchaeia archaeon]|nr:hypothetical protein [Candidatus Bathyarchaeia archaeon]